MCKIEHDKYVLTFPARYAAYAAFAVLLFPVLLFFAGWLRWYIGIPLAAVVGTGGFFLYRMLKSDTEEIRIDYGCLFLIFAVMFLWALLCGQGGFFPQKTDHLWRNAIFYDLIHGEWPVTYDTYFHGKMVYYLCYWLPPALIGKLCSLFGVRAGTLGGHAALLIWTTLNLFILALLLLSCLKRFDRKTVIATLLLLILFSGMDYIGQFIVSHSLAVHHLEWWLGRWQYTSNTAQLGWVFNQQVPAWLCTALFLRYPRWEFFGVYMGLILAFAPFPAIGLGFLLLGCFQWEVIAAVFRKNMDVLHAWYKRVFSLPNLLIFFPSLVIFGLFYLTNRNMSGSSSQIAGGVAMNLKYSETVLYVLFITLEFLLISLLIFRKSRVKLWFLCVISLQMIPLIRFVSLDFCMRVSIPALFVLMFIIIEFLLEKKPKSPIGIIRYLLVCILLLYGVMTPFAELWDSLKMLKTNVPFRLEHLNSFAEYLPHSIIAASPKESQKNFYTWEPEQTFFFRCLAKQNIRPVSTPQNQELCRLVQLPFDMLRKERYCLDGTFSGDSKFSILGFGQWLLFFTERQNDVQTMTAEYESPDGTLPLKVFAIPVKTSSGIRNLFAVNAFLSKYMPYILHITCRDKRDQVIVSESVELRKNEKTQKEEK